MYNELIHKLCSKFNNIQWLNSNTIKSLIDNNVESVKTGISQGWSMDNTESKLQFELWYIKYGYNAENPFDIDFDLEVMEIGKTINKELFDYCLKK